MSDTLFENHDSSTEVDVGEVYGVNWESEVFTVGATGHTVSSVKLQLRRVGDLTGRTLTVSVKAVDGSYHPTGSDLCSTTANPSGYSTSNTLTEYTFSSPATLSASTSYAIVARMDGGDSSNKLVVVGTANPGSGVSNEKRTDSADSGSSWTTRGSTYEFFVYGLSSTAYNLSVDVGAFTLTGQNVTLTKALKMACDLGSFVLTGIDVSLKKGKSIVCDVGSFILTGIDVVLSKTGWANSSKNNVSATNSAKNNVSATNSAKNNVSVTNQSK